jgi:hypothetical protein
MREAPGGKTGILYRRRRLLRGGDGRMHVTPEFLLDVALLKECSAHEMQAAKGLGEVQEIPEK